MASLVTDRGIYMVAFGEPARECAKQAMTTARHFMPKVPIQLCSDRPLGIESSFVAQPDGDIGGRGAKLMAYDLTPNEWESVLYLDADTEVISADVEFYFDLIRDGWEFVICKDPMREDVAQLPRHKYDPAEVADLEAGLGTLHTLMLNGGVWAFARNDRVRRFFTAWREEWAKYGQRDQGALLRAIYANPLKIYVLGNEWNYFPAYSSRITEAAAVKHYPGMARRWGGQIRGRLDGTHAWQSVAKWEQAQQNKGGRR